MPEEQESQDIRSSRKARGLRLESIRKSLSLSRAIFAERMGMSPFTIQNWEIEKNNGLPDNKVHLVVKVLKQMGVHCPFEWLVHGIGPAPTIIDPILDEMRLNLSVETECSPEEEKTDISLIAQELKLFRKHYPKRTIDMMVNDDGMEPHYKMGHYVAGLVHSNNQISKTVGSDCIVQTEDGDILLRQVKKGSSENYYTLACSNANTTVPKPFLYDVKLLMAAPIIWIRRRSH